MSLDFSFRKAVDVLFVLLHQCFEVSLNLFSIRDIKLIKDTGTDQDHRRDGNDDDRQKHVSSQRLVITTVSMFNTVHVRALFRWYGASISAIFHCAIHAKAPTESPEGGLHKPQLSSISKGFFYFPETLDPPKHLKGGCCHEGPIFFTCGVKKPDTHVPAGSGLPCGACLIIKTTLSDG